MSRFSDFIRHLSEGQIEYHSRKTYFLTDRSHCNASGSASVEIEVPDGQWRLDMISGTASSYYQETGIMSLYFKRGEQRFELGDGPQFIDRQQKWMVLYPNIILDGDASDRIGLDAILANAADTFDLRAIIAQEEEVP